MGNKADVKRRALAIVKRFRRQLGIKADDSEPPGPPETTGEVSGDEEEEGAKAKFGDEWINVETINITHLDHNKQAFLKR